MPGLLLISPQFLNMVFHQMCRIIDQFLWRRFFVKFLNAYWSSKCYHICYKNNLITRQQFGFLSKCSTCIQLLDSVKLYADDIKINLEITNDTDCATLQTFIDKITV